MKTNRKFLIVFLNIFVIMSFLMVFDSCKSDEDTPEPEPCPTITNAPTKSSDWVSYVNWDYAIKVEIEAEDIDDEHMQYTPSDLEFIAGQPYILTIKMKNSNQEKHYFHSPDFYKAIATRKVQTSNAEYKAPYFDALELVLNGAAEIFFVPVKTGTYEMWCTITGHKDAGMKMTIDIVCGEGLSLDLEVDPNFNTALGSDPRRSGDDPVWETKQEIEVTMIEHSSEPGNEHYVFEPDTLHMTVDQAYVLKIINPATNESKHYFTAAEFFQTLVTRKAEDPKAELKVPYFKAVEILIGGYSELFIVPTEAGVYDVECTITGHAEAGMVGTIIVE